MAIKIPYLTIINISTLLTSLDLISLSIVTIYWTTEAIDYDFSTRDYWWYRSPSHGPDFRHTITISYDFHNENLVFASTGFTVLAGLAAFSGFFMLRVRRPHRPHLFP
jgi:hypothetical protein